MILLNPNTELALRGDDSELCHQRRTVPSASGAISFGPD